MGYVTIEEGFLYDPVVYVVEDKYCIVFNTLDKGLGFVTVNGKCYSDDNNGNINSEKKVHKVFVPMQELDEAKEYTITFVRVFERKAYFATSGKSLSKTYKFKPLTKTTDINIMHICDTHSSVSRPSQTAKYFGDDLDLMVFNGDIPNHSGSVEHIHTIFRIASEVGAGTIPVINSRGNHDTRGEAALIYDQFVGTTESGNLYYTFRIGNIWGVVLDCGEDKADDHLEYGGMANFKPYRAKQIDFLKKIIENKDKEYSAPGVKYRLGICHVRMDLDHNLHELETYTKWHELLNEIDIDLMLHGHEHRAYVIEGGRDTKFGPVNYPAVIGGYCKNQPDDKDFIANALTLKEDKIDIKFTNMKHELLEEHSFDLKK